jgi:hypothetical protein
MDVLRATQDLAVSYIDQNTIAVQILDAERAAYKATLDYEVAAKEKTKAQAGQLLALYDTKDALERQKIVTDEQAQAAEDSAQLDQVSLELDRNRLESELQLAETATEERRLRLLILDHLYRTERARLEAVLADEKATDLAKEEARRRLSAMNETYGNDKEAVMRQTRGPWEEYAKGIPDTADKMQKALERVRVDGVEALSDSLVGVITGVKSVGAAFKEVAAQIIADLLKIYIRKMIVGALSNAIGAIGGMGGLGGPSSNYGANPTTGPVGMARGGSFRVGGLGGTDRNILSVNGIPRARVSGSERIDVSNDNGGGGMSVQVIPSPYFDVVVDRRAAGVAAPMAVQAAIAGAGGAEYRAGRRARRMIP